MAFKIPPFPSDRCTRCYNPIAPDAWTVATIDGGRHSVSEEMTRAELATDAARELCEVAE